MNFSNSSPVSCSRVPGHRFQRGVTLIEILITLLVLAVGLLGLAALQGFSLQAGQVSYHRTQATNIGYEVADFARANRSVASEAFLETLGNQLAQARLPSGSAAVDLDTTTDELTVTVTWLDNREAEAETAGEGSASFEFSTRI
ncbi:MAG TPA: type IV pilus modification protein PilV [Wenzhouxiangellaceae bacterium]|nr:type IV pilus modification protein PilV [Wenzhouxiangellaceae bacterium]